MTEISEKENEPQNLHRPQATVPSQPESKVNNHRSVSLSLALRCSGRCSG